MIKCNMRLLALICCFYIAVFFSFGAFAQNLKPDLYPYAHTANPRYEAMAHDALRNKPNRFDFMRFRSLYINTRQYDPIGEETIKKMDQLAFDIDNAQDPEKRERAKFEYQLLVADHLAHIGVVLHALSYARQNRIYGNPEFFEWVREGLLDSVMNSRDGLSLKESYGVITLSEETLLLARLRVKLVKNEPVKEGRVYYNMNTVQDPQTDRSWTIFVNTTFPMSFLEKKQKFEKKQKRFNVPLQ